MPDPRHAQLDKALRTLTEDERCAVVLLRAYEVPTEDAAMMVGKSVVTLRKRLSRALRKLRRALDQPQEEK